MADRIDDRGCLIPAVHHAIGAFFVIAGPVGIPIGFLHQRLEGFGIAFAEQVTGTLPAEIGARRVAPRGATIGLVARQKVEKQAGLVERPAASATALGLALEDLPKQFLGAPA